MFLHDSARVFLTDEQAIAMLPDGDEIHTFKQTVAGVLLGADWSRADILDLIRNGQPELTGKTATSMGHGLAVGNVFIATKKP